MESKIRLLFCAIRDSLYIAIRLAFVLFYNSNNWGFRYDFIIILIISDQRD